MFRKQFKHIQQQTQKTPKVHFREKKTRKPHKIQKYQKKHDVFKIS